MLKQYFGILVLACCALTTQAQERTAFISDSLDNYVNTALKEHQVPGAAVCIIRNGKVSLIRTYGVREMNTKDPVDEQTLFMIGSNTKAFTATALAMLQADKKLSLDDHVQKWLPDFRLYDPWVTKTANIRDLLSHRLGFETFQGDFMYFDSDLTAKEVREKLARVKPVYSFRSRWGYTNAAFLTAGEIIPKASGLTWAEFIRQRIFKPLQMTRSLALSGEIANATNKAAAHTVVNGKLEKIPYGNLENLAPAGSISSSITDMSHWVTTLLNNGKYQDKQIIPEEAIEATRTPHSIIGDGQHPYNRAHFQLYGLGWFTQSYEGRLLVSHTGGVNGFVTSVMLLPEEKTGIIVLTNTDANNFYDALAQEIRDACLGLPFRDYAQTALKEQQEEEATIQQQLAVIRKQIANVPKNTVSLQAFVGQYQHDIYGKMNITLEKGTLIMRFQHHTGLEGKLEPLGDNQLFCTYNRSIYGMKKLPYKMEKGKVKAITVKVAGFVEFTPYEFRKL